MLSFPLSFAYVLTVASATPSARGTSLKFVPPRMDQQQPAASKRVTAASLSWDEGTIRRRSNRGKDSWMCSATSAQRAGS